MNTLKIEYTNTSPEIFPGFNQTLLGECLPKNDAKHLKENINRIGKAYADELFHRIHNDGIIISSRFDTVEHPTEYSYFTDRLVMLLELDMDKLRTYCYTTFRTEFAAYLQTEWVDAYSKIRTSSVSDFAENEKFDTETCANYYPIIMTEFYILHSLKGEMNEASIIENIVY